jgi:hypothetical protein
LATYDPQLSLNASAPQTDLAAFESIIKIDADLIFEVKKRLGADFSGQLNKSYSDPLPRFMPLSQ